MTENLWVNHELHKISKLIVEEAIRTNAVIVVGKLKGVRKNIKGGKRNKRLINNFPYYWLLQYIKYKAEWTGVMVLQVGEAYTSITCSNCYTRKTQGLFKCINCHKYYFCFPPKATLFDSSGLTTWGGTFVGGITGIFYTLSRSFLLFNWVKTISK